jgi:hypothetical protein
MASGITETNENEKVFGEMWYSTYLKFRGGIDLDSIKMMGGERFQEL